MIGIERPATLTLGLSVVGLLRRQNGGKLRSIRLAGYETPIAHVSAFSGGRVKSCGLGSGGLGLTSPVPRF